MKICLFPHDIVQYDGKNYYSNSIKAMIERYADPEDFVDIAAPIINVEKPQMQKIEIENVSFKHIDNINNLKKLLNYQKVKKKFKDFIQEADLCIFHIPLIQSNIAFEVANKLKKPIITVVCGCPWDSLWNYNIKGKMLAPIIYYWQKSILKRAKNSIYVTKFFLQNRYPTFGNFVNCSNVELNIQENVIEKRKLRIKNLPQNITLGTVAAIDVPYKGQEYVIKALYELKKSGIIYNYNIIGHGNPSRLQNIIDKLNLNNQVTIYGGVSHSQIFEILDSIDIYIQPSKQEGLPRAVIEAMSRGCLCMGSNIAGIPELLDNKYLFKAGNVNKIVKLLKNITKDDLLNQAERNIKESKKYSKTILDLKRRNFIHKVKENIQIQ